MDNKRTEMLRAQRAEYLQARVEFEALGAEREKLRRRYQEELSSIDERRRAFRERMEQLLCNVEEWDELGD